MDALVERIEALEEEREIIQALYRYSHKVDYGPPEVWANVFTEDGVFDVYGIDGKSIHKEKGREELAHYLSTKKLPPVLYDKHLISSPVINVKGNKARVESYFVMLRDKDETGAMVVSYGRYHDTLVKKNGTWLIKERRAEVETSFR